MSGRDSEARSIVKPCLANGAGRASTAGRPMRVWITYCGLERCPGPRKCKACKAAYMRAWREAGRAKPGPVDKLRARGQVSMAIHRGTIIRQPCEVCGRTPAEAHHDDYSKPKEVRWLCRPHHRAHHEGEGKRQ